MVRSQPRWPLLAWSAILLCVTGFAFAEQSAAERRGLIFVREYCSQCHAIGKIGGSPVGSHIASQTCSDLCLRESIRRCRDFSLRLVK
jgi:hypothetical protein